MTMTNAVERTRKEILADIADNGFCTNTEDYCNHTCDCTECSNWKLPEIKFVTGKTGNKIPYLMQVPEGYKEIKNTFTNPIGYKWYSNGLSIFDKDYKQVLVKEVLEL